MPSSSCQIERDFGISGNMCEAIPKGEHHLHTPKSFVYAVDEDRDVGLEDMPSDLLAEFMSSTSLGDEWGGNTRTLNVKSVRPSCDGCCEQHFFRHRHPLYHSGPAVSPAAATQHVAVAALIKTVETAAPKALTTGPKCAEDVAATTRMPMCWLCYARCPTWWGPRGSSRPSAKCISAWSRTPTCCPWTARTRCAVPVEDLAGGRRSRRLVEGDYNLLLETPQRSEPRAALGRRVGGYSRPECGAGAAGSAVPRKTLTKEIKSVVDLHLELQRLQHWPDSCGDSEVVLCLVATARTRSVAASAYWRCVTG
ncbi:hypothetical protein PC122_g18060 [Phytophthora cactorum]|nr:hypothetical protein PC122_g18060 [Phytophthora cactorum]